MHIIILYIFKVFELVDFAAYKVIPRTTRRILAVKNPLSISSFSSIQKIAKFLKSYTNPILLYFCFVLQMNDGHDLLQGGGDWTNVIIPGNAQNPGFNHKMTYEVSSLRNDAEYECLVQARNQFGWSEASRIFHFYTGKRGKHNIFFSTNSILKI